MMLTAPPTFSQDNSGFDAETRWQFDAGAVVVLGEDDQAELLGDFEARLDWEAITSEGRRWGFVLAGRVERDPSRTGWGGRVGQCPAGQADCADDGSGNALRGVTSGLQAGADESFDDFRGALTLAYGFAHFGYGEVRLGYGDGAARLDAVAPPTSFRLSRADNGRVDLTGLSASRTFNYASGQSPKLVFRSIALGQTRTIGSFRGSLSYTPTADGCGVDVCDYQDGPIGVSVPQIEDVLELGGLYEIQRGETDVSFSIGYATGSAEPAGPALTDLQVLDAGLRFDRNGWSGGVRWLHSNNATDGDYEALSASLAREQGDWLYALEWAGFSDNTVHADGQTLQLGASKLIGDHWLAGLGLQYGERDEARVTPAGRRAETVDSTTFFIELGWRY